VVFFSVLFINDVKVSGEAWICFTYYPLIVTWFPYKG